MKIAIASALSLEQEALLKFLTDIEDIEHPVTHSIYKSGKINIKGRSVSVLLLRTNQTNINAGIETERIISFYSPSYLFFVGVAGGLKDVSIGDVVVASDVYGYERGKDSGQFSGRPQFAASSYELEQLAVNYATSSKWQDRAASIVSTKFHDRIAVRSGTIASGEKVIGAIDASQYEYIKQNCSHALAVEMEGLGFLEACRQHPQIKCLLIRGISDLIDKKEVADKGGSQEYASKTAGEFLFGLLKELDCESSTHTLHSFRQLLTEVAPKLYPMGVMDQQIFRRAGGDISALALQTNGRTQWFSAIELIENGGGGEVTFASLLREMKKDFANNKYLQSIIV